MGNPSSTRRRVVSIASIVYVGTGLSITIALLAAGLTRHTDWGYWKHNGAAGLAAFRRYDRQTGTLAVASFFTALAAITVLVVLLIALRRIRPDQPRFARTARWALVISTLTIVGLAVAGITAAFMSRAVL